MSLYVFLTRFIAIIDCLSKWVFAKSSIDIPGANFCKSISILDLAKTHFDRQSIIAINLVKNTNNDIAFLDKIDKIMVNYIIQLYTNESIYNTVYKTNYKYPL